MRRQILGAVLVLACLGVSACQPASSGITAPPPTRPTTVEASAVAGGLKATLEVPFGQLSSDTTHAAWFAVRNVTGQTLRLGARASLSVHDSAGRLLSLTFPDDGLPPDARMGAAPNVMVGPRQTVGRALTFTLPRPGSYRLDAGWRELSGRPVVGVPTVEITVTAR